MKKIFITLFAALISAAAVNAKSASQLRVYINPGHGSYGSNDRPMALVNKATLDTTGFFESNTNLRKGFGVLEKLIQYGLTFDRTKNQTATPLPKRGAARDMTNNIVMSHVKCGGSAAGEAITNTTGFNQALTAICEEVDANNFDYFISIHSNSATEGTTTNFPLFLYRGTDSAEKVSGSKAFAQKCWPHAYGNTHMVWTNYSATSTNIRGDISFYGSSSTYGYLGALKHNVPGFLVEGYFHTYQPARHRAMNWDVDYLEGYQYARGLADYAGLTKESTGDIYGIVRSATEQYTHTYYKPNSASDDVYLPLNGCKVTLKNSSGATVATYTTDTYYNGAYVFKDLPVGTYTITYSKSGYDASEVTTTATVTAAKTTYVSAKLPQSGVTPTPTPSTVNYPDPAGDAGITAPSSFEFQQDYVDTEMLDSDGNSLLTDKTIRRVLVWKNIVYILAHDSSGNPYLYEWNHNTNKFNRKCSTSGTSGATYALSDIALTADGVLVGINKATVALGGTAPFFVYKWTNTNNGYANANAPTKWFSTNLMGNWSNGIAAEALTYSGSSQSGFILYSGTSTASTGGTRIVKAFVTNGTVADGLYFLDNNASPGVTTANIGTTFNLYLSPLDESRYIIDGTSILPREYTTGTANRDTPTYIGELKSGIVNASVVNYGMFKYGGNVYAVVPTATGPKMANISSGIASASVVTTTNTTIASGSGDLAAVGRTYVDSDTGQGVVQLIYIRGNKISKFSTPIVQPQVPDKVYLLGNYEGQAFLPNNGVEMTYDSSANTYTLEGYFDVNDGSNKAYFSFSNAISSDPNDWSSIASSRFGAVSNGNFVVKDDNVNWFNQELSLTRSNGQTFEMPAGNYRIVVKYGNGQTDMKVVVTPISATVADPVFSPAPGTYNKVVNISITSPTDGANIYITTNGTDPTINSFELTKELTITHSYTIKAVAYKNGVYSNVVTGTYTVTDEPEIDPSKFVFTQVMQTSSNIPEKADNRFSTGYGDYVYVVDRTNTSIYRFNTSGTRSTFKTGMTDIGYAITADDAGNIIAQKGFATAASARNWWIIEPNGTTHDLSLTMPDGVTASTVTTVGRIVGNVLSSEGAYWTIVPGTNTKAAIFKIANGAQVSATSVDLGWTADNSALGQPVFTSVAAIDADPTHAFAYRLRGNKAITTKAINRTSSDGFDVFTLGNKTYAVEPTGTGAYTDAYAIVELGSSEALAEHPETLATGQGQRFQSLTARPTEDGTAVYIYQNVSGSLVSIYRFGMPPTGVDVIAPDQAVKEASVAFYNLQGQRIVSPQAGQIAIRVAKMSDGTLRTTKVVIR